MSCAICEKRPAKRYCPAKSERICAICCGREREATIDCAPDCPHLIAAHRYEAEHRAPIPAEQLPYREIQVRPDFVYERWPVVTGMAETVLRFQIEHKELNDSDAGAAIEALTETYRTLGTGIYYERPPGAQLARALYGRLVTLLGEFQKSEDKRAGFPTLRETDIFQLLVFLLRVAKQETNGRRLSRAFLGFLRERFLLPAEETKEPSRIIVP